MILLLTFHASLQERTEALLSLTFKERLSLRRLAFFHFILTMPLSLPTTAHAHNQEWSSILWCNRRLTQVIFGCR